MRICPQCNEETTESYCPKDNLKTVDLDSFQKLERHDPMVGLVLGEKYQIEVLVGFGGFGSVYRARHVQTGGSLAVKVLSRARIQDDAAVKRFYLEAENTHRLQHHNTVRLFDFGETDTGLLYLVMEYVEGKTLAEVMLESRRFSPFRVVRICEQILKSLAEAHEKNVVHRDIKPDNIMLVNRMGDEDFVKVLDFGVSRTVGAEEKITVSGTVGTPAYIAPEQWSGDDSIDGRADLYSVGCLMYRLLTGNTPFHLDSKGPDIALQYLKAHMEVIPTPIENHVKGCPPALSSLVMSLLEKKPAARPKSAIEFIEKLRQLKDSGVLLSEPLSMENMEVFEFDMEADSKEVTSYYGAPIDGRVVDYSPPVNKTSLSKKIRSRIQRWEWKKTGLAGLGVLVVITLVGLWRMEETQRFFNKTHAPLPFPSTGQSEARGRSVEAPAEKQENVALPQAGTADEESSPPQEKAPDRVLQLRSTPVGAVVYIKGEKKRIGKTPMDMNVEGKIAEHQNQTGQVELLFRYKGRKPEALVISDKQLEDPDRIYRVVLKKKKKPSWDY